MNIETPDVPVGTLDGLKTSWKADMLSGFLVFLIAFRYASRSHSRADTRRSRVSSPRIVGGILSAFISNSELTIKGPPRGLSLSRSAASPSSASRAARTRGGSAGVSLALGVGVVAGAIQILFGLFRSGFSVSSFRRPRSTACWRRSACSSSRRRFRSRSVSREGSALERLASFPRYFMEMNPAMRSSAASAS